MAQSRFSAELPLEAVVARICEGIHSSPDLFKSDIRLSLASNATVRTPEESLTGNPSEAKMATIEFSVAADLRTPGKFNERDFIWVHRSDNGIGAEVSISSLPCNERDSADVMTAIKTFVEKRSEMQLDDELITAMKERSFQAKPSSKSTSHRTSPQKAAGNALSYALLAIFIFGALVLLGTCVAGGGGSSKSHSTEETAEFLTNIDTPGTSEYKWYHDEYLPDNDLPDR